MTHLCRCDPCRCNDHGAGHSDRADDTASEFQAGRLRHPGFWFWKRARRRPDRSCRRKADMPEPPLGAHLVTPRRGYTHHGIYAGNGEVLHYAGLSRSIRSGPVEQVRLAEFANGRSVLVECRSERALDGQEVVARARSRLGENRYRLLTNNCEHFSEWSRFGVSRSSQVDRWIGRPASVLRNLASPASWVAWASLSSRRAERATT